MHMVVGRITFVWNMFMFGDPLMIQLTY